ncbi:unnamed protein product [Adineta steineri]|uniref:DUF4378 domain-containing protein n=1 Tax=Adineta steineri TaxID=433720 RepID=A0A818U2L0_9BILA|nr:unnamed protein product [Adineta steineri]
MDRSPQRPLILTAREKRVRQKFNSDIELQAYEKRLKDIEKKIRQLVKRAFEIFDENRSVSSPPTVARTVKPDIRTKPSNLSQDELSINEETSIHQKDTEPTKKDNDTSSSSNQQRQSDVVTSDASDLECRVRAYREQLKAKKLELERLKQRKNKEILRRQEDELKKQIESYDHEIQTLRLQPVQQEQTVPVPSSSSSSSIQRSKSNEKKNLSHNNEDKEVDLRLLQTPRDERDTQHDALSIPIDLKQDYDSRRTSIESTKAPLDLNTNLPVSSKEEEEESVSSSLSSSSKSSEKPIKLPSPQISKSPFPSPSPSPSESSQTTSSSKQERSKSPSPPPPPPLASSEPIKSISVATENRAKSPTSPAPSESSTSSYSSVPDRIKSPTPPPTSSQPVQSTQERIKSPSPPLSQSIKSTSSLIQERIKSPSLSESSSSSLDKYIKPSVLTEPVRSTSSSESSFSSLDKNIKSSVPPEPIQSTASVQERIKSPSSSSSESSSSSVDKHIKPSEPIKSTSSSIQERIKSPSSSASSSSSIDKHFKSPVPPEPIQSTSSVQERIKSLSLSSSESTSVSIQNHIKSSSPAAPSERIQSISSSTQPHVKSPSPPILESIKSPSIHEQTPIPIIPRQRSHTSSTNNDYDEDFSETSHSQIETSGKIKIDDIDIESIEEDIDVKHSTHDTNHSSTSKSSGDEQSEILVLVKKSANNTPREPDQSNLPNEIFPSSPRLQKIETDDTSHDISEVDDGNQYIEQQKKADILTETLIKVFIEEAIQQGKEIVYRKSQNSFTKEVSEWLSDEDLTDEENNNKQIPNNHDEDVDNVIQTLAIQQEFLEQLDAAANGNHENDELNLDLSHLEDKNPDGSQIDNSARLAIDIPVKPVVPHTCEQVSQLCHEALTILYNYNTDFSDRSSIDRAIPASYFAIDFSSNQNEETENDDIQRSRHAYNQMIFDLCVELLHEMYSPNIRLTKYPEWQKTKLISKRFYRSNKPKTRDEAENFIEKKIFEILNLIPRQIVYSKWRMLIDRRHGHEQFEMVLDEELRRTENSWIDYDDDCIRIKFDISEHIFEQLIQETLVDCIDVINKKLSLSSNITRL